MGGTAVIGLLVLAVSSGIVCILGVTVLMQDVSSRLNRRFFGLTVFASLWVATNILFVIVPEPLRLIVATVCYGCAAALATFFVLFCNNLARIHFRYHLNKLFAAWGFLTAVLASIPGVVGASVDDELRIQTLPLGMTLFSVFIIFSLVTGLIILIRMGRRTSGQDRDRARAVLGALLVAVVFGVVCNLILPIFNIYSFVTLGPLGTLGFSIITTYAIVRHGLFDIKLAAVRSLAYALSLLVLAGVYYFIAYVMSIVFFKGQTSAAVSLSPINVMIAVLLAFMFQPIKSFFDQVTDKVFFRDRYKTDDFYASINDVVTSTTDLRGLLQHTAMEIGGALKSSQAFFFVRYNHTHYVSAGTPDHVLMTDREVALIDDYLQGSEAIFLTERLDGRLPIYGLLTKRRIGLVVPLMRHATIIGYLFLGDQQGSRYTRRDIHVLHTIRNELVIAIQNALSLHEVREINATLQQRIDAATKELRASNLELRKLDEVKDEFVSMASHQLRTPLTSVKGYVSMVLEGDAGKITPQQHKLLSEAFNSSERMVHLIADFLSVSRLQTGKFVIDKTMNDLSAVVRQEIDALKLIAKAHDLRLEYFPSYRYLPQMVFDDAKVRQVIMNFIDNAIYYSRKDSKITVRLEKDGEMAIFTVTDTGIGVPEHEQAKLFNKFFRAQNARRQRPDGTGVGLFLAKKIITAHGGEMIFHSTEGEGSTFGFRMPIVTKLDEEVV